MILHFFKQAAYNRNMGDFGKVDKSMQRCYNNHVA